MAQFQIDIPDELLPALAAEFSTVQGSTTATTAEDYFAASVVETVRQRAELYKVGPYFAGVVEPRFLVDGRGNPNYTGPDAIPYVVVYPTDNDGVEWTDGDQWTDPLTDIVYELTDGVWAEPQPVVDGDDV